MVVTLEESPIFVGMLKEPTEGMVQKVGQLALSDSSDNQGGKYFLVKSERRPGAR